MLIFMADTIIPKAVVRLWKISPFPCKIAVSMKHHDPLDTYLLNTLQNGVYVSLFSLSQIFLLLAIKTEQKILNNSEPDVCTVTVL